LGTEANPNLFFDYWGLCRTQSESPFKFLSHTLSEFSLIDRFFKRRTVNAEITQSIGDDCALLSIPSGYELAITTDTMVESVHFFPNVNPFDLGHKLLAVNLSDLAAMGAKPLAVTLALTLPKVDEVWLNPFAEGFFALADKYQIDLIGGDTTQGSLTLTVQAFGTVPQGRALKRSAAKSGDIVCVTGNLGDAGLGLKIRQGYCTNNPGHALKRFNRPEPRIEAGLGLLNFANACIDVSDGLCGDLGHILKQSNVGACLDWESLPLSSEVRQYIQETGDWLMPVNAGDDYELCFTISPENSEKLTVPFIQIGVIEAEPGLRMRQSGKLLSLEVQGFVHFS
jgi:thiamine-monophosphate kinase